MMSEKRFECMVKKGTHSGVYDNQKQHNQGMGDELWVGEVVDLLNKQQATIIKQKEEIKKLKRTERSWRRIHCCNKESDNCGIVIGQQAKIDRLNSDYNYLKEVNKETVKQCERWKTLYEIKDKEVTVRVKRLNEICNQYKYAITFDKDIDPNDAVNILCDRILQTEVENDE